MRGDDRVLRSTRILAAGILPFLLAGWVILYLVPDRTATLFAWTVVPSMTSMVLASAYAGGAYFFARVLRETRWHRIKAGFPAVALFAALLGVVTVVHWDRFAHANPAFWIWSTLYFVAPFLVVAVWLANRRHEGPASPDAARLTTAQAAAIGGGGALTAVLGLVMLVAPAAVIPTWPWSLTPLTCRVLGAVFCLGVAGLVVLRDDRCSTVVRMLEVALVMAGFVAVALLRARDELDLSRPMTWVMFAGVAALLVGGGLLLRRLREPSR